MSKAKWTAGPWKDTGLSFIRTANSDEYPVASVYGFCGNSGIDDTSRANSYLIAAAPELYAALALFVEQWNACGPNSDFGRYFGNVREAAVKALAKAQGESA